MSRKGAAGWMSRVLAVALVLAGLSGHRAMAADAGSVDPAKPSMEPRDSALRETERRAMIAFYEAMNGPDWIERDFWASERPVGEWHGVETDREGRVVRLTIYDNNLTGELSPAVCELERLHTLHLSFNKIAGALPERIGACRGLRNIWLKGNRITGELPASVATLPDLEYLDLHANDMSGPLPEAWDTPKLRIVRAEDNRMSGRLPEQLLRQPRLEELFLHNNDLSGPIPQQFGGALRSILLANNRLSGPIPNAIGTLQGLVDLRLNGNELSGPIPPNLVGLTSLQVLRLDRNRLSGPVPVWPGKPPTIFDISDNPGLVSQR